MQIALFKGKSAVSRLIRWFTRSKFSHAAFVFDERAQNTAIQMVKDGLRFKKLDYISVGSVVEAWQGGVKNSPSVSTLHTRGTPISIMSYAHQISLDQERRLILYLDQDIGLPYDYMDIVRFILRVNGHPGESVFCSFEVARRQHDIDYPLFARTEGWRVPPDWLWRTIALRFDRNIIST